MHHVMVRQKLKCDQLSEALRLRDIHQQLESTQPEVARRATTGSTTRSAFADLHVSDNDDAWFAGLATFFENYRSTLEEP